MSLVKEIENLEIERDNNRHLHDRTRQRMLTDIQEDETEIAQLEALLQNKKMRRDAKQKALTVVDQEFADRDAALAAMIGGE